MAKCKQLACKEVLKINFVVCKKDTRPLSEINSSPTMVGKWLFDTGVGITSMSSQHFRPIPIEDKPKKLNLNQSETKDAYGTTLIPDGSNLFPMKWSENH